jgi:Na+-transporting NADH:ubiquinone oxidoreductase subunit A
MKKLAINKGFNLEIAGRPDAFIKTIPPQEFVAVSALDIPYIRPKLLVQEKERVQTGSPIFCDKRDKTIHYVSPATGTIKKIQFGPRRRLLAVVIECEDQDDYLSFDPISEINAIAPDTLIALLKKGGLWQCFRQFPYKDTANSERQPPMIIVSLDGNDIFSPTPGLLLNNQHEMFELGLDVLKKFSKNVIVTVRESHSNLLESSQKHITHVVPDIYPSWDPGVVLYHLKRSADENVSWCISADHLIMMAKFLSTGHYPVERLVTISKPDELKPHYLIRQGTPIKSFLGTIPENTLISTGHFNGRLASIDDYAGFFENTFNVISVDDQERMFGFVHPGTNSPTMSKTFLSCLVERKVSVDATLHGEERACINCSYCENICPNDLMPQYIMKALVTDEIEDALQLGLLDCCRCGLCAYACPSKIELTEILSNGIDQYYATISKS